ncbi:hypothetical protein VP01_35g4 [Puccinia sorghi]|uniref:Uncharacterized protein n=1 Tax=Puccinia sorghi TaxID=27349 RepID=A0A0L6UX10_9BASI|nr:hypothetical protein VP01_35g4 [Puccinia sorghi]
MLWPAAVYNKYLSSKYLGGYGKVLGQLAGAKMMCVGTNGGVCGCIRTCLFLVFFFVCFSLVVLGYSSSSKAHTHTSMQRVDGGGSRGEIGKCDFKASWLGDVGVLSHLLSLGKTNTMERILYRRSTINYVEEDFFFDLLSVQQSDIFIIIRRHPFAQKKNKRMALYLQRVCIYKMGGLHLSPSRTDLSATVFFLGEPRWLAMRGRSGATTDCMRSWSDPLADPRGSFPDEEAAGPNWGQAQFGRDVKVFKRQYVEIYIVINTFIVLSPTHSLASAGIKSPIRIEIGRRRLPLTTGGFSTYIKILPPFSTSSKITILKYTKPLFNNPSTPQKMPHPILPQGRGPGPSDGESGVDMHVAEGPLPDVPPPQVDRISTVLGFKDGIS